MHGRFLSFILPWDPKCPITGANHGSSSGVNTMDIQLLIQYLLMQLASAPVLTTTSMEQERVNQLIFVVLPTQPKASTLPASHKLCSSVS